MAKINITATVDDTDHQALKLIATALDRPISWLLRDAAREAIKKYKGKLPKAR